MSTRNKLPIDALDDDNEALSLSGVAGPRDRNQPLTAQQRDAVKQTSIDAGFPSRASRRRRPTKSPHTQQFTVRVRPEFKQTFHDLSDTKGIYDYQTFERAIIALLEKENRTEELNRLHALQ